MREFIINRKNNNNKVSNCIKDTFPNVPTSKVFMALRNKDIRVNDIKVSTDVAVNESDKITVYIKDEILFNLPDNLNIVYEDDNILVINKPANLLSEDNAKNTEPSAESILKKQCNNETLKLCHRLDRNTSGLLIFSKNEITYNELLTAFKENYIIKRYLAYVEGVPKVKKATLTAYLFKDSKNSSVIISPIQKKGYEEIKTEYKVIEEFIDYSLLEVTLHTGKTHQIRAHLSYVGHPVIGDR